MIRISALALAVTVLAACQHNGDDPVPAVLDDMSDATMQSLKSALAASLNKTGVRLADADLTQTSLVTVVPPPPGPLETRSTALPIEYRLLLAGDTCYGERSSTGERIDLPGVSCRAL